MPKAVTAVEVDFKMRRERKAEKDNEFWIMVTATPQSPEVHEVKIDMYQLDRECYSLYGVGLTPYPLESGHPYTWDHEKGDLVLVIVRSNEKSDHFTWKVAAQGVWMSDGGYFRSGQTLRDRSELFA